MIETLPPELKRKQRVRKPHVNGAIDRLPPHSPEAEQGVLGCVMLSPSCLSECREHLSAGPESFYDLRHQTIFRILVQMSARREAIDVITLQQRLKDEDLLEQVGGLQYLSSLPETVPSAANLSYYLNIVQEKALLRRMVQTCTEAVGRIYDYQGDVDELVWSVQSDLGNLCAIPLNNATLKLDPEQLMNYTTENDPNALIGVSSDGKTTRYLCRGYGGWLIGPSGIGKSSLVIQMAILWALGRPFMGITPTRKMRVLVVQAENDEGDLAEMVQGVCNKLGMDTWSEEFVDLNDRLKFVTERSLIGERFCGWLRRQIEVHRADIVFGDPFLSFAGIDVSRQEQCSKFLRNWLNPVLSATGAVMIGAHHTGKPKFERGQREMTAHDYAYAGIGSSELVNWARVIMVVIPHGDYYELKLAKRGPRAGAVHPDGETRTTSLWLRHAQDRIFWEQVEPPQESNEKHAGGRPSKVKQLLELGLGSLIDQLTEPASKNELAKRIEAYAASRDLDVKRNVCLSAIEQLVANHAIQKTENGYQKHGG